MTKPLLVEIIAYAPTAYYHCTHCEVAWREMGATNRIHEEQMKPYQTGYGRCSVCIATPFCSK